jgi:hypothetical protein
MRIDAVVALLVLPACSFLINPDELRGAQTTSDGGIAEDSSGLRDAQGAVDSSGLRDAQGAVDSGATVTPCDASHLFCENFEAASPSASWRTIQPTGTLLETTKVRARTGSQSFRMRKTQVGTKAFTYLERSVSAPRIRCEADFYYETFPAPESAVYLLAASAPQPFAYVEYTITRAADGLFGLGQYREPSNFVGAPAGDTFGPLKTWIHLKFSINGALVAANFPNTTSSFSPTPPNTAGGWLLQIGTPFEKSAGNWDYFIDDIFCDALP